METSEIGRFPNPWQPITKKIDLKHLGKLGEEAGELGAIISRVIIQGMDEKEPRTGKVNRAALTEEIADVVANIDLVVTHFGLDIEAIRDRAARKRDMLREWHKMLET